MGAFYFILQGLFSGQSDGFLSLGTKGQAYALQVGGG